MEARMSARLELLSLATAAALALPMQVHAKAPTKSEIDSAVIALDDEWKGGINEAKDLLGGAQERWHDAKTALSAAKLRQEAERLRLSQAELELKAIDGETQAAELIAATSELEALAVQRARGLATIEWRKSRIDANKLLLQLRNAQISLAKAWVGQRDADLEREKLEALANASDDPDTHRAAGKAFQVAARKRKSALRADKNVKKVERKWDRAVRVANKQQPKETGDALKAAYDAAVLEKAAQVVEARDQVAKERAQNEVLLSRLEELQQGQEERMVALEDKTAAASAGKQSRIDELAAQLQEERATHADELAEVREEMGRDASTGAAREIAALQSDLAASLAKEKTLGMEVETLRTQRDELARDAARLEAERDASRNSGDVEVDELKKKLLEAGRDATESAAAAEEKLDASQGELARLKGRAAALEEELERSESASAAASGEDTEDLLTLIATMKRQLSFQRASSEEQVDLIQRQLTTAERKHEARVDELATALEVARGDGDGLALAAADAERDRDAVLAELERTKSQRDEQSNEVTRLESKIADQKADFQQRLDELKVAVAGVDAANSELKVVQAELEAIRAELMLATSEAKSFRDAASESGSVRAELTSQVMSLELALEKETAKGVATKDDANARVDEATAALTRSHEVNAELSAEVEMLEAQVQAIAARMDKEIAQAVSSARAEQSDDEGLRAEVELSLAAAEARSSELGVELQSAQLHRQALQRDLAQAQMTLDEKELGEAQLTEQLADMANRLRALDAEGKSRIAWLTAEISSAGTTVGVQRDRLAQFEEGQRERDRSIARLQAENKALRGHIDGGK